jgi:hypothetical protein
MSGSLIEGIYRDRLVGPNNEVLLDSGWKSNMIVLRCRVLLAGFMKNEASAHGIQSLKFGKGDAAWDQLANLKLEYLNPRNSDLSAQATNCVQISATLGPGQPPAPDPYPLREFGLFGQMNNTEFMIDYVRHPVIEKDSLMTLERKVRLIF